jgi:predicted ATPase
VSSGRYPPDVSVPVLSSLRLTAFKSFRDVELPIDPITVLTGRNSSGKSNGLDGMEVLSRLATGEDLGDALDGRRREGGTVRGGSRGCAPHGENRFALGCTVTAGGERYDLDVTVQTEPELRIIEETLSGPAPAEQSGEIERRQLLRTRTGDGTAGIAGEVYNGLRGGNPVLQFRDTRLLTSQLELRVSEDTRSHAKVVDVARAVTGALRGVFHLDPVPHLMRDYVPERDNDLRRTGENVSAAIFKLSRDNPVAFTRLVSTVQAVADDRIRGITVSRSPLGDVMLTLSERAGSRSEETPAREMSDGLLRFVAIATALLSSRAGLDIDTGPAATVDPGVLLVIEELENGLHPSQAGNVLGLIKDAVSVGGTRVVVTTHSPALLNYMTGELTRSVLVCYRGADGRSRISRLPDLPGYAAAMAAGRLGDVVSDGRLVQPEAAERDYGEFNRLLGIE